MGPIEIVTIVLAVGIVAFTVIYQIVRRKKGRSQCDGCSGNCAACKKANKQKDPRK